MICSRSLRAAVLFGCSALGFAALAQSRYTEPFPTAPSKKGIQVQMVDDALALLPSEGTTLILITHSPRTVAHLRARVHVITAHRVRHHRPPSPMSSRPPPRSEYFPKPGNPPPQPFQSLEDTLRFLSLSDIRRSMLDVRRFRR